MTKKSSSYRSSSVTSKCICEGEWMIGMRVTRLCILDGGPRGIPKAPVPMLRVFAHWHTRLRKGRTGSGSMPARYSGSCELFSFGKAAPVWRRICFFMPSFFHFVGKTWTFHNNDSIQSGKIPIVFHRKSMRLPNFWGNY